ncbi:allantoate amidohydrolase [Gulosibacter molinativorax]|uniref:Allantoate amidohydrolase n=1 Tax=Gulosibacter molinativorax TaxID=256821 RepID=A0ABT7C7N8_9MICO|nr:allantoate amidohydrolase [Gulosibacter molinativorax]MDJ1371210.1 allantoate amidohydrolase [Gulosibacter molinativorax]QUY63025.1 Amidase, hydantoinase/carbamoylase family protein [Gulosibacter molinativorax]
MTSNLIEGNQRTDRVTSLLSAIADVGRDSARGGYSRPVYSTAELDLRSWFIAEAIARGLDVETDRNGIMWAWWDTPSGDRSGAVVTGSHLDSVPGGGAFDGPLGVASALAAVDVLRAQGRQPDRALAIAVFPEEEGSRYGIACLGSRILTGAISLDKALALTDEDGNTFAEQSAAAGLDPRHMGPDPERLAQIGAFVELHVEQGRGLIDLGQAVAIGSSILGHGRWRLSFTGQGNHAGTTLMQDRRDPLVAAGALIGQIPSVARAHDGARATVGRLQPIPGGTNVIASRVDVWLDVRHPDDAVTAQVVAEISQRADELAREQGCAVSVREESLSPTVSFDAGLRRRLEVTLPDAPVLDTGAGHDAGILASHVPTAMLFVRNPTGVSHAHEEHVEDADAEIGAEALAAVLVSDLGLGPGS